MFEIPDDLHPDCLPLAWLLGRWEGAGVGEYPTVEAHRFGQEITFGYVPGHAFLTYASRAWALDEHGQLTEPLNQETGYWRPAGEGSAEVVMTHPAGVVEVYIGEVESAKIELATRGVLKTETAPDYRTGHRLYGLVNGRLMYVYEVSAEGAPLQPRMSAELQRVAGARDVRETVPEGVAVPDGTPPGSTTPGSTTNGDGSGPSSSGPSESAPE